MNTSTASIEGTEPTRSQNIRQGAAIVSMLLAFYFLLFPLAVVAGDAAGFSLRNKSKIGKAITNPLVWVAEKVPPYKGYLMTSRQLIQLLYPPD